MKFLLRFFVLIQLVKETLISTNCEGERKLSSKAICGDEGDGDLAKFSICFEVFSVMLVWVLLSISRAGLRVLQCLCAVLRSTWTSIGALAVWKASTAWSWVVTERLLPFTYRIKSLNKIRHVGQGFQNNNNTYYSMLFNPGNKSKLTTNNSILEPYNKWYCNFFWGSVCV